MPAWRPPPWSDGGPQDSASSEDQDTPTLPNAESRSCGEARVKPPFAADLDSCNCLCYVICPRMSRLLLSFFRHDLSKRKFLFCRKRNFSHCGDNQRVRFDCFGATST